MVHTAKSRSKTTVSILAAAALIAFTPLRSAIAATTISTTAANNGNVLHVTAISTDAAALANTQELIDTDAYARTGFTGAGDHGFDVMVEGETVYTFSGEDPTVWTWKKVGVAKRKVDGTKLIVDVPAELLGKMSPKADVLVRALSSDYKVLASGEATVTDPSKPAAAAATLSAKVSQDGGDLKLVVTAKTAADLNTQLIFFDTDDNADTGFQPPADPRFGFEYMIQGGSLSRHVGSARGGWGWETVAPVTQVIDGSTTTITFNASLLKSTAVRMSLWQMSADWQTRTAFFPAEGDKATTLDVPIDAAKLHAEAAEPAIEPAPVHANAGDNPVIRFHTAKTYSCYYGAGKFNELSHDDVAILHVPAQTPQSVEALNKVGVVTIGYISVGEDESLRVGNGKGPGGKASWYFSSKAPNTPDENGIWGSYYANASDPAWRADRVEQAKHLTGHTPGDWGFDGIFLDTVETVDAYPESREGMIKLIEELHAALPGKVIVINRGFSLLKEPRVCSNIDGLMYESFTDSYDFNTKSYIRFAPQDLDSTRVVMQSTVNPAVQKFNLRVLALDYCLPTQTDRIQECVDRAATFNMLDDCTTIGLDAVYPVWTYTPHPQQKYLSQLATPEAIRFTMPADRNGFPAGTVVQPSSCFMGYTVGSIVDGVTDRSKLDWTKAAWASAETPGSGQEIAFTLPTPVPAKSLTITFATDNGKPYPSQKINLKVQSKPDGPWRDVAVDDASHPTVLTVMLPGDPVSAVKIEQPAGGGPVGRPDILWVAQVALSR